MQGCDTASSSFALFPAYPLVRHQSEGMHGVGKYNVGAFPERRGQHMTQVAGVDALHTYVVKS